MTEQPTGHPRQSEETAASDAEEAAHARTADRMNHIWAHGSGIDRYLY